MKQLEYSALYVIKNQKGQGLFASYGLAWSSYLIRNSPLSSSSASASIRDMPPWNHCCWVSGIEGSVAKNNRLCHYYAITLVTHQLAAPQWEVYGIRKSTWDHQMMATLLKAYWTPCLVILLLCYHKCLLVPGHLSDHVIPHDH